MIYRIRVILDNDTKEDIFRDLEIIKDSSLKDLHELILSAFKFSGEEMSSFFTVDEEWNQIDEISLMNFDNSTKSMDSINLCSLINHNNTKLLYVYDFMKMWTFYVELVEEGELISNLKYIDHLPMPIHLVLMYILFLHLFLEQLLFLIL